MLAALASLVMVVPSHAQADCGRVVIFTLPGVTWHDVARYRPPSLLAAIEQGAAGSLSVRTNSARTTYASGFATIGAGSRLDGGRSTGGILQQDSGGPIELVEGVRAGGISELRELADAAGYSAVPGALGDALGTIPTIAIGNSDLAIDPPVPLGYGRWSVLAAMDRSGVVDLAGVDSDVLMIENGNVRTDPGAMATLIDAALSRPCAVTVVDPGDLIRSDTSDPAARLVWPDAVASADANLALVMDRLDPAKDLLLIASPTSPLRERTTHFGVAVAVGPAFHAGGSLTS
ncbi:MAG TPA: hypothetical protein VG408_02430, partial [Actinomycetota bacterium]|nr:hypothetical protein [Actinomycetota bacterium]